MTQLSFGAVAPTSRRAVAYVIDALIAAVIGIVLAIILVVVAVIAGANGMLAVIGVGAPIIWLVMLGWFVVYTYMQSGDGSIGMRTQGLRLVREGDGARLGFGKTLLRNIIFGLSASIVVGYFTPLFDGSGRFQGWHDKVAQSLMLDARAGGAAVTTPATEAISVPPRPPLPDGAPRVPSGSAFPAPAFPPTPYSEAHAPALTEDAAGLDETVRSIHEVRRAPAPETPAPQHQASGPATGEERLIAFVPGITQDGPPARTTPAAPAPVVPPVPATPVPVPFPASDPVATSAEPPSQTPDDDADIEDTRISIPGHRLVFTWDDGTKVTVSRRTLFGRNPAAEEGAVAMPVRDETLSLSKTHFEAAAEASGGWIMDRHSTNGTVIVRDGHRIECTPGEQVRVRLGDAIEIGDRIVTIGGYA